MDESVPEFDSACVSAQHAALAAQLIEAAIDLIDHTQRRSWWPSLVVSFVRFLRCGEIRVKPRSANSSQNGSQS